MSTNYGHTIQRMNNSKREKSLNNSSYNNPQLFKNISTGGGQDSHRNKDMSTNEMLASKLQNSSVQGSLGAVQSHRVSNNTDELSKTEKNVLGNRASKTPKETFGLTKQANQTMTQNRKRMTTN